MSEEATFDNRLKLVNVPLATPSQQKLFQSLMDWPGLGYS
jgi:hypothetical protein